MAPTKANRGSLLASYRAVKSSRKTNHSLKRKRCMWRRYIEKKNCDYMQFVKETLGENTWSRYFPHRDHNYGATEVLEALAKEMDPPPEPQEPPIVEPSSLDVIACENKSQQSDTLTAALRTTMF